MIRFLVLFQELLVCFTVFASEEDSLTRTAYFTARENKYLAGHVVQRLRSSNLMSCNHICTRTSWCTSTTFSEGICELNKHEFAPIDADNKLIDQPGVIFSAFFKGCLVTGCLNGGSCLFNEKQETFTCSCKQQWIGDNCKVKMASCPAGWLRHGCACYYIDDTPTTKQADARTTCQNMGADLPVIRSAAENNFIFNLTKNQSTVTHYGVWLGMHRSAADSKFYWFDGTPAKGQQYHNWKPNEPNNGRNREDCGNMFGTPAGSLQEGKWNDLPCDHSEIGNSAPVILCQKPISDCVPAQLA